MSLTNARGGTPEPSARVVSQAWPNMDEPRRSTCTPTPRQSTSSAEQRPVDPRRSFHRPDTNSAEMPDVEDRVIAYGTDAAHGPSSVGPLQRAGLNPNTQHASTPSDYHTVTSTLTDDDDARRHSPQDAVTNAVTNTNGGSGSDRFAYTPPPTGHVSVLQTCRACGSPLFDTLQPDGKDEKRKRRPCNSNSGGGEAVLSRTQSEWTARGLTPVGDDSEDRLLCTGCGRSRKLCRAERPLLAETTWSLRSALDDSWFRCSRLKHLYQCFFFKHRRTSLIYVCLMVISYHAALAAVELGSLQQWRHRLIYHIATMLAAAVLLLLMLRLPSANPARTVDPVTFPIDSLCLACTRSNSPPYQRLSTRKEDLDTSGRTFRQVRVIGLICLVLIVAEPFVYLFQWSPPRQMVSGAWYMILASSCIHTMLPLSLTASIPLVAALDVAYLLVTYLFAEAATGDPVHQVCALALLLVSANVLGIVRSAHTNKKQRDEFLTSLSCLKSTREVQGYIALQEQLLNSVVPEHIAEQLKRDIDHNGALLPNQANIASSCRDRGKRKGSFRDVILTKHDNVTILVADIVGFTRLSAEMPAKKLMHLLNNLFSRFDDLSTANHCYRITTLGDCYVCVSGMPKPHAEHANNCVKLGLKMVEETGRMAAEGQLDLAVRIGVHSGFVVAGVLGQVKWHYDIYCDAVCTATAMEAAGVPGRVHVSEHTRQLLAADAYVLSDREPADTGLAFATYLIEPMTNTSSSEPTVPPATPGPDSSEPTDMPVPDLELPVPRDWAVSTPFSGFVICPPAQADGTFLPGASGGFAGDTIMCNDAAMRRPSDVHVDEDFESGQEGVLSVNGEPVMAVCDTMASVLSNQQLGKVRARNMNRCTLSFLPEGLETMYQKEEDKQLDVQMFVAVIVIALTLTALSLVNTHLRELHWPLTIHLVLTLIYIGLSKAANSWEMAFFPGHHRFIRYCQRSVCFRYVYLTFTILIIPCFVIMSLHTCEPTTLLHFSNSTSRTNTGCDFPEYSVLAFVIAIKLPLVFSTMHSYYIWSVSFGLVAAMVTLIFTTFHRVFERKDLYLQEFYPGLKFTDYRAIGVIAIVLAFISNVLHGRMGEEIRRFSYLCSWRITNKQHAMDTLQMHNKHLLLNIMPKHVADYFLDAPRSPGLYAKDHRKAGVLFASIPNFRGFQRDGQCLATSHEDNVRVLNEIVCMFDAVLTSVLPDGRPRFGDVEKIKTVSSSYTYIVAAGLQSSDHDDYSNDADSSGGDKDRRDRSCGASSRCPALDLVRLAQAMQEKLDAFNHDTFYSFDLRCGIHQGPLVSGVIGAKKPLFDIFGDTVNIASRMDSTGEERRIQVVQDVAEELRRHGCSTVSRPHVDVKGLGLMATAFVERAKCLQPEGRAS